MDRRGFVATLATGVVASISGCGGDGGAEPTDTPTATTTDDEPTPTEPEPAPTTTTERDTATQQPTTTGTASFAVAIESIDPADREVYDGLAAVTARVQNVGSAAGQHTATVALQHRYLDRTYTEDVTLTLGAGESQRIRLRADFRTTGVYDVLINGERVDSLTVERLSEPSGRRGGRSTAAPPNDDPVIDVVATGNVVAK